MKGLKELIGLRYGNRGRGPDEFDCYGLFIKASKELFNHEVPDYLDYYKSDDPTSVTQSIDGHKQTWTHIEFGSELPGDVIILTIKAMPVHVGIVLGNKKMLHTLPGKNACIDIYTTISWRKRIQGFYRWEQ